MCIRGKNINPTYGQLTAYSNFTDLLYTLCCCTPPCMEMAGGLVWFLVAITNNVSHWRGDVVEIRERDEVER